MFFRWKKAVLVKWLPWCSKERLLSNMSPRLRMCWEGDRVVLSMVRQKLGLVLVRDMGPMMIMSDLSPLSLRKLVCIHDLVSVKQLVRAE